MEVEGYRAAGKLIATQVTLKSSRGTRDALSGTWEGYISAVNANGGIFVNGQLVSVAGAVIVGGTAASLVPGTRVEVRGLIQAGVLAAVRIEVKSGGDGRHHGEIDSSELRGTIAGFEGLSRFTINGQLVDASRAYVENGSTSSLANGALVEAHGSLQAGVFVASRIEIKSPRGFGSDDNSHGRSSFKLEGTVMNLTGGSRFEVNGQPVDASGAWFEDGTAADLRNGAWVEVKGVLTGGVLVAYKVDFGEVRSSRDDDGDDDDDDSDDGVKARGTISTFASVSDFVVAGQRLDATLARFEHGHAGMLAVGVYVEAKGRLVAGRLVASKVEFAH